MFSNRYEKLHQEWVQKAANDDAAQKHIIIRISEIESALAGIKAAPAADMRRVTELERKIDSFDIWKAELMCLTAQKNKSGSHRLTTFGRRLLR